MPRTDAVAVEEPLEIELDGETLAVTMRTPGADAPLAIGFLFSEGIIEGLADIGSIVPCNLPDAHGNVIDVRSAPGTVLRAERALASRRFAPTQSACGVCGRSTIRDLIARCGRVTNDTVWDADTLVRAASTLAKTQPVFQATGGLHAAALFEASGGLIAAFEDIGRHNAVDKVIGSLVQRGLSGPGVPAAPAAPCPRPALLVVSGRASFEVIQKAAVAGIPVVASVSAASSLAIDLADAAGITLVSFVREDRLSVYTHLARIRGVASDSH